MTGSLTEAQIETYRRDGRLSPMDVLDGEEARALRTRLEALERDQAAGAGGRPLGQYLRVNGQIVLPLFAEIARHPAILDAVESVLGPNLLVWSVEAFIKEPGSEKRVSWHQDLTYWGMGETDEEVTAWLALSDVSVEAGCMRFIPGSHLNPIIAHRDSFAEDNLLSRGQEIAGVDESLAEHGPLKPGQLSLHHGRCLHASGPNRSSDRRVGLAIRYVTPEVRQGDLGRDYAMLARGGDAVGGWIPVAGATRLFDPADLALYERILKDQAAHLAAGAEGAVALYAQG